MDSLPSVVISILTEMNPALILIDEFGHPHLEVSKIGSFSHFIYTSLILDRENETYARELRSHICKKYRLGPDMKSSNLKEKHFDKRLNILTDLVKELDFTIEVLVVDKSKLDESKGLIFHKVFYKYFQSNFVNKYNNRYRAYTIFADKVGEDFKYELEEFVRRNGVEKDMFFPDRYYSLKDDIKEEKLIQISDLVCGSIVKRMG